VEGWNPKIYGGMPVAKAIIWANTDTEGRKRR